MTATPATGNRFPGRLLLIALALCANAAVAEVANVTITARALVADGQSFGNTGPYEKLAGSIEFAATGARIAGVGMAAIRDAATAFRTRRDLPVHGDRAYVFGSSQSGRFLRTFLHEGFNVDERGRRAFDLVWSHIAGAAQGSFNERFANPGYLSFPNTRFPYTDADETDAQGHRDGLLHGYTRTQRPKIIYTNTPVEYWGLARAAALTHTSSDGKRDLKLPANVRMYLLSGTQHSEVPLPPPAGQGQALGNPTPQTNVMRALLHADVNEAVQRAGRHWDWAVTPR